MIMTRSSSRLLAALALLILSVSTNVSPVRVTAFSSSASSSGVNTNSKQRIFVGTPMPNHPERTVGDCMATFTTVKLTPDQSADEAIAALLSHNLQAAPVIDPNDPTRLLGIVTSYDFLQREAFEGAVVPVDPSDGRENVESYVSAARKICARRVSDVMTQNPHTVSRTVGMRDAAATMARDKIHTMPVVDDGGAFVGMITSEDVMRDVLNVIQSLPEGTTGGGSDGGGGEMKP
mmetsp:Transcript_8126/g.17587  ORF Transcript_8126/g.17587 Transcript_8126/m.17587 type:complete len:234 (+) Transcript_8126:96-797(+)